MEAFVVSVNISSQKGVVKEPVMEIELIEDFGIKGDAHGGPGKRQVSFLAKESADKMVALGAKDIYSGRFAENITTQGISLHTLEVGTLLKVGETMHEVSQIGKECHSGCAIKEQVGSCIMPTEGIFTRVITGGKVRAFDKIEIVSKVV